MPETEPEKRSASAERGSSGDRLFVGNQTALPDAAKPPETRLLEWAIFGEYGVRAGWRAALFLVVMQLAAAIAGVGASLLMGPWLAQTRSISAAETILGDGVSVIGLAAALLLLWRMERRPVGRYYWGGPRGGLHFLSGVAGGFLAVSALVLALYSCGFLRFVAAAQTTAQAVEFGLVWAAAFLLVGLTEEGTFRSYLLYTLPRGMNFWWSGGCVAALCLWALLNPLGNGSAGVYLVAALGIGPCLWLEVAKSTASGFWQTAWLTSTAFGFVHTFNDGESWIGIFAAALIGFVFCVSVRLTGSVWWAVGFHAAWDWTQTFFYGTPDSGLAPQGHYLTTLPAGAALWSGGTDGPEGSILVLPVVMLVLLALLIFYRRPPASDSPSTAVQPQLS